MIGGQIYPIRTDFRTAVRYEQLALAEKLTAEDFLALWFPEEKPGDIREALRAVGLFYNMGRESCDEPKGPAAYSLREDGEILYADFLRHYGVDLTERALHWWQFRALLEGLVTHSFRQRVGYRTADLKGLDAAQRAEILKYRRHYAVEGVRGEDLSQHLKRLAQISQRTNE